MNAKNMNIYVGNLPLEITEDELCKEFTEFGEVVTQPVDIAVAREPVQQPVHMQVPSFDKGHTTVPRNPRLPGCHCVV